jgi:Hsp70 protein
MIRFTVRSGLITARAPMGIWNRLKRGGLPQPPGPGTLPQPPGPDALPYSPAPGTLPCSVGIETRGGGFTAVIARGAPLPVSVTETFITAKSSLQIGVFQGEHPRAADNTGLGLFEVTQIPPGGRGEPPQIEVTFRVDASGAFSMTARDARAGLDLPVLQR